MSCMKRVIALLLTMFLLSGMLSVNALAAEEEVIMCGIGHIITSSLRLYKEPDPDSEVLSTAEEGECIVVISQEEDDVWCRVNYNLQEGYMRSDCLTIETQVNTELGTGRIKEPIVYLRSGPGTEYSILDSGRRDEIYYILGIHNGWYRLLNEKSTCYIRSDLMELTEIPPENEASDSYPRYYRWGKIIDLPTFQECEPVKMAPTGGYYVPISGGGILSSASRFVGVPYVYGGYSPSGFDCSGLVYYVLTEMGYPAPRTAVGQYSLGYSVSRSALVPGDLVFFANTYTSGISHVGIYAGGGKFLHAPSDGSSVCYTKLSGYWSDHYYGARRLG